MRKVKDQGPSIKGRWEIELLGPVKAKKNSLRPSRWGGLYQDPVAARIIEGLILQARTQWTEDYPVDNPTMVFKFFCANLRSDIDNRLTVILDVLVQAGVLIDDRMSHLRGPITIMGFVDKDNERVEIEIIKE